MPAIQRRHEAQRLWRGEAELRRVALVSRLLTARAQMRHPHLAASGCAARCPAVPGDLAVWTTGAAAAGTVRESAPFGTPVVQASDGGRTARSLGGMPQKSIALGSVAADAQGASASPTVPLAQDPDRTTNDARRHAKDRLAAWSGDVAESRRATSSLGVNPTTSI